VPPRCARQCVVHVSKLHGGQKEHPHFSLFPHTRTALPHMRTALPHVRTALPPYAQAHLGGGGLHPL